MDNKDILTSIKGSKKYKDLLTNTIDNVSIATPYSSDSIRSKLHQIWGAYYTSRPDFNKLLKKLKADELDIHTLVKIHSSSKERDVESKMIFDYIFSVVGTGISVLDIGCGFNPIFLLDRKELNSYLCVDIDGAQQNFFSEVFRYFQKLNMSAQIGDALVDKFEFKDVVFAFKLLTVLDQINPDQTNQFLRNLKCNYLVVSLPNKSLGGKEKGMVANYRQAYVSRIGDMGFHLVKDMKFNNETVYIFKSKTGQ